MNRTGSFTVGSGDRPVHVCGRLDQKEFGPGILKNDGRSDGFRLFHDILHEFFVHRLRVVQTQKVPLALENDCLVLEKPPQHVCFLLPVRPHNVLSP